MEFRNHLFISYAHIDNQPLTSDQQGWITRFHHSLEAMLNMRMGENTKIWRDEKLQGNDKVTNEILEQFNHTAVLISVLTPRYLNSKWCTKEVNDFCQIAENNGGIYIENKSRVVKVIKTPVDTRQSLLHPVMKDSLGYQFFAYEDDKPLELDPAFGQKFAQDYNREVGKLAWDMAQLLQTLEHNNSSSQGLSQSSKKKPTVYLSQCSFDQKKTREILETDLKSQGYRVLPDQRLPLAEEDYMEAVDYLLSQCSLSIHLVGNKYGFVPDGPTLKSATMLQNDCAVQRCKSSNLERIIWLPRNTSSEEPLQQAFIDALHQDAETQYGADLISGDIEELKTSIYTKLEQPEAAQIDILPTSVTGNKLIYLICDQADRRATVPLRKFLKQQGFEVELPFFESTSTTELREANKRLLTRCDAVILFYGSGNETWKRTKDNELKKMLGYRGGKPLLASYTYLAEPKTIHKQDLIDMEEPNLINGLDNFARSAMSNLCKVMNS